MGVGRSMGLWMGFIAPNVMWVTRECDAGSGTVKEQTAGKEEKGRF